VPVAAGGESILELARSMRLECRDDNGGILIMRRLRIDLGSVVLSVVRTVRQRA
jgi:hypothetical protein